MFHDDKHVLTGRGVVIWDGITRPDNKDPEKIIHSIKIAIAPGSLEIAELEQLAHGALAADSVFKGQLPSGGNWPVKTIDPGSSDPTVDGYTAINAKTFNGAPQVFDASGKILDPMQYGRMLYPGAIVKILLHAYTFNKQSKGVAFGLDGIGIVDATTPKLSIAAGIDVGAAFGGGAPPVVAPPAPGVLPVVPPTVVPPRTEVIPAPDFLTPTPPAPAPASGPVMTAKANGKTHGEFIAAGWNDEQLRAQGYIV